MAPTSVPSPEEQKGIIKELQASVKKVLKDYVSALVISFPNHFRKMPPLGPQGKPNLLSPGARAVDTPQRNGKNGSCWDFCLFCQTNPRLSLLLVPQEEKEKGVQEQERFQIPCLTFNPQSPHNIESSAILPYLRAIKRSFDNDDDIIDIINHLHKLKFQQGPETTVPVPTNSFEGKSFTLSILKAFSKCLTSDFNSHDPRRGQS
ncbi:interleukin-31 [Sus scrofa]|uniref:interleukin-31 n=1 Tax=Sus scrofa TaxID=9823 RepID=UPI000A2B5563|nr:interleukin-31 [Sus scrofa]